MKNLLFSSILTFIIFNASFSQEAPLWMRYPAISPSGQTIVFSFKGDLYTVPAAGGQARLLTFHEGYDQLPVWSPDGQTIAFASDRFGNFDIYTIPAEGGKANRITTHSSGEYPGSFTPDGKFILFSVHIQDVPENTQYPTGMFTELYKVPANGGRPVQVLSTPALEASMEAGAHIAMFTECS